MKLGINIPNYGPPTTPESLLGWARFAEEAGFAIAMMSDHVAPTPDVTALYPAPFYDPFATLSWLAGQTRTVQLGTTVTVLPYRHPLHTARLATNLDQLSGGRFVLGVGIGWSEPEYAALGVDFRRRGAIADEYLAIVLDAFNNDEVSYDGQFASFDQVSTGPRALQEPHPPVWVGGTSLAGVRRAVRFGDAWHVINPAAQWLQEVALPAMTAAAADAGRPAPDLTPRIKAHLLPHDVTDVDRPLGRGNAEQIRGDIELLRELGSTYVILDANPDHPADRQPPERDWETLSRIADLVR
jgi:probable F420-dependent oxidoreductase